VSDTPQTIAIAADAGDEIEISMSDIGDPSIGTRTFSPIVRESSREAKTPLIPPIR